MPMPADQSVSVPGSFQTITLARAIASASRRGPEKTAIIEGNRSLTYSQLTDRIFQVTGAVLDGLGLQKGDHAAILARNCLEYMEIVAGCAEAGVPAATVNPRLSLPEVVAICDDAQAKVLFVDAANAEACKDADFATVEHVIEIGADYEAWRNQGRAPAGRTSVFEWEPFAIPYTSGTTGKPKGVLVSHRSRLMSVYGMASEYGCHGPDDKFLSITPLCHGAGFVFPMAALCTGGATEILPKFEPELVLRKLKQDDFTGVFLVPTLFHAMFGLEQSVLDANQGSQVKSIISNAAPLPQATKEQIVSYYGEGKLFECYGSTEAGVVTNLRPQDQLRKLQCVGQPFASTDVELRNEAGEEVGPNEVGELFARGPSLFNGYWQRPDETDAAFQGDWVTVGDLAKRDEEGFLYIVDRKKDMIISGGINIYPREIEEVLHGHPALADVAVIGVPDEKWGERLKAYLVKKPGAPDLAEDELETFLDGKVARYKIPRELTYIETLPRNANGKVLKTELKKAG